MSSSGSASSASVASTAAPPSRIERLDEATVNRIAAGEVVHRPSSALKEMIENSLDAKSTSISVSVKDGGLTLLQIVDTGHGIQKDDFPLLCERFATSKLSTFEDLNTIRTYGFRGEALASISHVARVSVTSMVPGAPCAFKASFADGKVVGAGVQATAGVRGTSITVEDMFFNVPARRAALKNKSEEYNRILEVVQRYALHHASRGIGFVCKKLGDLVPDVQIAANTSTLDAIGAVFGQGVKRELLAFAVEVGTMGAHGGSTQQQKPGDSSSGSASSSGDALSFMCKGFVSNANFNMKKGTFVLFINDRLVECGALKKALDAVYSTILPKGTHAFVYLSIDIPPEHVDVNVHPTKREVNFLFQEELVAAVTGRLSSLMAGANASRTFATQALLPLPGLVPAGPGPSSGWEGGTLGAEGLVAAAATQRASGSALLRSEVQSSSFRGPGAPGSGALGRVGGAGAEAAVAGRARAFAAAYASSSAAAAELGAPPSATGELISLDEEEDGAPGAGDGLEGLPQAPGLGNGDRGPGASGSGGADLLADASGEGVGVVSLRDSSSSDPQQQQQGAGGRSSSGLRASQRGAPGAGAPRVTLTQTQLTQELGLLDSTAPEVKLRSSAVGGKLRATAGGGSGSAAAAPSRMVRVDSTHRSLEPYLLPRGSSSSAPQSQHSRRVGASTGVAAAAEEEEEKEGEDDDLVMTIGEEGEGGVEDAGQSTDVEAEGEDALMHAAAAAVEEAAHATGGGEVSGDPDEIVLLMQSDAPSSSSSSSSSAGPTGRSSSSQQQRIARPNEQLTSIAELRASVAADTHAGLAGMLSKCVFVGLLDNHRSLVQYNTRLLLLCHAQLARELFYQRALALFGAAPRIVLKPAADVAEMLLLALDAYGMGAPESRHSLAADAAGLLASKAAMLEEYFSVGIRVLAPAQGGEAGGAGTKRKAVTRLPAAPPSRHPLHAGLLGSADPELGQEAEDAPARPPPIVLLTHLPQLLEGHAPLTGLLPEFLLTLAFDVDWAGEKECFHSMCGALGAFYACCQPLPPAATTVSTHIDGQASSSASSTGGAQGGAAAPSSAPSLAPQPALPADFEALRADPGSAYWAVERVLLPAFRTALQPPRKLATGHHVVQIACVEQLYKIFERC